MASQELSRGTKASPPQVQNGTLGIWTPTDYLEHQIEFCPFTGYRQTRVTFQVASGATESCLCRCRMESQPCALALEKD